MSSGQELNSSGCHYYCKGFLMRERIFFFLCVLLTHFALCKVCVSQTDHFFFKDSTGDSYSIVIDSVVIDGREVENGDEIGVFTSDSLCVGASILDDTLPLPIVAWKDDPLTPEIDGYTLGDTMHFKFWNSSEGIEMDAEPRYTVGDGTFGYGSYSRLSLCMSASAVEEVSEEVSYSLVLAQNYPNPFNMETKISYALPEDCDVKLTIYNITGQKIKVLVDGHPTAGYKDVCWDGKDDKGREVASGIYFYKIEAGEFTQSKKMLILK